MKWIYVLKCDDNIYYVGQTRRLYRRFWEHFGGLGGLNTLTYTPQQIVAIYPVNRLGKFFYYSDIIRNNDYEAKSNIYFDKHGIITNFNINENDNEEYDCLWVENNITEKMIIDNKDTGREIRGGKYVRFDIKYNYPDNKFITDLPNCNCGLPCDVKQNEDDYYLYFRCAKKNLWDDIIENFEVYEEPCNFFMKYTKDNNYRTEYYKKREKIISLSYSSKWLKNLHSNDDNCIGGCGKRYDGNNTVRYFKKSINLCFNCFIDKYDELSKKYITIDDFAECIIED